MPHSPTTQREDDTRDVFRGAGSDSARGKMSVMGYRDLLPQVDSVTSEMIDAGLSPEQRQRIMSAVGTLLVEYSDYHLNEYQRVGERQDQGAHDALAELAQDFLSESRCPTAVE